jgi:hypothetical protein
MYHDEIHQLFVPGRHKPPGRRFDAGGALAMILLIRRIKWLRTFPAFQVFNDWKTRRKSWPGQDRPKISLGDKC